MIRLGDLTLFRRCDPVAADAETGELSGGVYPFTEDHPRTVRLTINTASKTVVTIWPFDPELGQIASDEPLFRVMVEGLQPVEFYALGAFALEGDAEFWVMSHDGTETHVVIPDAETFTRIAERRPRNPEIERLEEMLIRNNERRMGAMLDEVRREREAYERAREALDIGEGSPGGDQSASEPANSAGEPASSSGTPPSGTEGAEGDS